MILLIAIAANTAMNTNCTATKIRFALASSLMPRMFSPVTRTTAITTHIHSGVLGK